jgi:hypothetical protein
VTCQPPDCEKSIARSGPVRYDWQPSSVAFASEAFGGHAGTGPLGDDGMAGQGGERGHWVYARDGHNLLDRLQIEVQAATGADPGLERLQL